MRLYRFIDTQKATFPIRKLCQVLSVPKSSYYDWHSVGRSNTDERKRDDLKILDEIHKGLFSTK